MGNVFNKVCCTEKDANYSKQTADTNYNTNQTDSSNAHIEPPSPEIRSLIESTADIHSSRTGMVSVSNTLCQQSKNDISEMYIKVQSIGKGLFGNVNKVMHKKTAVVHSMKVLPKINCKDMYTQNEIQDELNVITKLEHPFIIKTISFYNDDDNYYIINEYCKEGDLSEKLLSSTYFDESVVKDIMLQIFTALLYLHSHNVVHGDLKLENILIKSISTINETQTYNIKLIDYGYSKLFSQNKKQNVDLISTTVYSSPEVLINNYDEASDVWACGVIMYLLLSGELPFLGDTENDTRAKILKGEFSFDSQRFNAISIESKHLITQCLTFNKLKRISIKDALQHDFFMKGSHVYTNIFHTDIKNIKYVLKAIMRGKNGNALYNTVLTYLLDNYDARNETDLINKTFLSIDSDMDGKISRDEFGKAFERCKIKGTSQEEVNRVFERSDVNKSGFIEYEEFSRNALANMEGLLCEGNLKKAFDTFDLSKNGVITFNELIEVIGNDNCDDDEYNKLRQSLFAGGIEGITFEHFKEIMLGV